MDLPTLISSTSLFPTFTGTQLRHNDLRIFTDLSRIYIYNCDEKFKTTSRTSSENMPGHA